MAPGLETLRRWVLIGIGWWWISMARAQVAQGGLQAAVPADPKPVEPGTVIRRTVVVTSRLPGPVELLEEVLVPEGWRLLPLDEPQFTIQPGQKTVRFIAAAIPKGDSGTRRILYRLRTAADGVEALPSIPVTVEVRGRAEIRLSLGETPEFLMPGTWSTNWVQVANPGGVPLRMRLRVQATPAADIQLKDEVLELKPGETAVVPLAISPRAQETTRFLQSLRIQGEATDPSGNPVAVPLLGTSVEVIGGGPKSIDPWVRIPSRLQFGSTVDQSGQSAALMELNGIGVLDSASEGQLSYRIRPTVVGSSPLIFDQDQYFVSYSSRGVDWTFGDGIRSLSPLTQTFGQDRGVRFENRGNPTRAGFLLSESVQTISPERRSGGFLEQDLAPWWSVRSAYLHQESVSDPVLDGKPLGDIASIQTRLSWTNRFRLEVESAQSEASSRQPGAWEAYRVELQAKLPKRAEMQVQARSVGEGYLSPGRDNDALSGSVSAPVFGVNRAEISVNRNVVGLHGAREERLGQERTGVFRSDSVSAQVQRSPGVGSRMAVGVRERNRELERGDQRNSVSEDTGFGSVSRTLGRWTVAFDAEGGRSVQDGSGPGGWVSRVGARSEFRPNGRHAYGMFVRYGDPVLVVDLDPVLSTGFNTEWQIGDRNRLLLNGSVEQVPRTGERREFGSVQARRVRENGHEISARGQVIVAGEGDEEAGVFLQYTVPFGMPVGRKRGLARIQGRVVDRDDGLSAGVSRAVVTLNREWKAVTTADGAFDFPHLKPGSYVLEIESRSIGFGRVVVDTAPIVVQARPDGVTRVEVGVTAGASLEVVVTVFEDTTSIVGPGATGSDGQFREKSGLVDEVVEIQMDKLVRRLATDSKGSVRFSGLVPGTWQVRVGQNSLPPNHFLDRYDPEVKLESGKDHRIQVKVLPRRRALRFIDSDG